MNHRLFFFTIFQHANRVILLKPTLSYSFTFLFWPGPWFVPPFFFHFFFLPSNTDFILGAAYLTAAVKYSSSHRNMVPFRAHIKILFMRKAVLYGCCKVTPLLFWRYYYYKFFYKDITCLLSPHNGLFTANKW